MLLGYNTNGFSDHRLEDAFAILWEIGYRSVAVTVERDLLDPPNRRGVALAVARLQRLLKAFPARVTVETGSRFILDPRRKHQPTLISRAPEDRARRVEFLQAAIDLAAAIGADSVSLWSGRADDAAAEHELFDRLTESLRLLLSYTESKNVRLSFEPEPGMLIDTMSRFAELIRRVDHPLLGLTLDVGHVCCLDDGNIDRHLNEWQDRLWNVHIEDMRPGVHEHLMFGEGEIDVQKVFLGLRGINYLGPVHVELSRHSHDAVTTAKHSCEFLGQFIR